jgi:hypothetical protein
MLEAWALVLVAHTQALGAGVVTALLASTLAAGTTSGAVYITLRHQAKQAEVDRLRIAYRQLIRAGNRMVYAVKELAFFPKGHLIPPGTEPPAGYDPLAEAKHLLEEAHNLVVEAEVTLSLEEAAEETVYDAFEATETAYWEFIVAHRQENRSLMEETRAELSKAIEALASAARQHLATYP